MVFRESKAFSHRVGELLSDEDFRLLQVSLLLKPDQGKVIPGSADKSYGIEVARLAALPQAVIERAREILSLHETTEHKMSGELIQKPKPAAPLQIQLFEPVGYDIAARIRALNLDELRPIEALQLLAELQKELKH